VLTTYWSESTIIVMIRWTGLAPWEFEFPFSGSLTSTFLARRASDPGRLRRATRRTPRPERPGTNPPICTLNPGPQPPTPPPPNPNPLANALLSLARLCSRKPRVEGNTLGAQRVPLVFSSSSLLLSSLGLSHTKVYEP